MSDADRAMLYKDKAGKWRWRVVAPNERVVGASTEGYDNAEDARDNLIRNGHGDLIGAPGEPSAE